MGRLKIAIMGAGLIGRRHAEHVMAADSVTLSAIIDPTDAARGFAASLGVEWFDSFAAVPADRRPDGVIVATPNQMHVDNGLEVVAAGIPALVEKPLAHDVDAARLLVETAERAGVPLLTGHHRRYNPMIRKARETVEAGRLGQVLSLQGTFWLKKPDNYFDTAWRRQEGAGPVYINLIHEIDLFRYLLGDITAVQAFEANILRGNPVDESAVILLRFASGALATVNVSDAIPAPWSWELSTGENPAYPQQDQACYQIGGTLGSLTIPQLEFWHYPAAQGWWEPLSRQRIPYAPADPLKLQIRHFAEVIRGEAAPVVSGRDGLEALRVIEAIKAAARSGTQVRLDGDTSSLPAEGRGL